MPCIQNQFTINAEETPGVITDLVENIAGGIVKKGNIISTFFNDDVKFKEFKNFLYNRLSDEALNKLAIDTPEELTFDKITLINKNTLKSAINVFYNLTVRDVENYNAARSNTSTGIWINERVRNLAINHTINTIKTIYFTTLGKNITDKLLKTSVKRNLILEYYVDYIIPTVEYVLKNGSNKEKALAEKVMETITILNTYNRKDRKQLEEFLNIFPQINTSIFILANELTTKHNQFKNFTNIYYELESDSDAWINEALASKDIKSVNRFLEGLDEVEKEAYDNDDEDGGDTNPGNDDSKDEGSKNWNDQMKKSFESLLSGNIKLYLSTTPKLSQPVKRGDIRYIYDTNNELGVPEYHSWDYLVNQIVGNNLITFDDVESFIEQLYEASETNPELYSLGKIANDLKNNRALANNLFYELSAPRIAKSIITISENEITQSVSNLDVNKATAMLNQLQNNAMFTVRNKFNIEFNTTINQALENLDKNANPTNIETADEVIYYFFDTYFPSIDKNDIERLLYKGDSNNSIQTHKRVLKYINSIQKDLDKFKDDYNNALIADADIRNAYAETIADEAFALEDYKSWIETKNYLYSQLNSNVNKLNFDSFTSKAFINLASELSNVSSIAVKLNSYNAEGNLASNIINHSKITNILHQITYFTIAADGTKVQTGLNNLMNTIKDKHQYDLEPFFFGVKDKNGAYIKDGIFKKDAAGNITINKNATDLIKVALFDGIRNANNNKSAMYNSMSKADYFMSMMQSFITPNNFYDTERENLNKFGGYFMRTPSDAPKNFIVRLNKYKYTDLFIGDSVNHNSEIFRALLTLAKGELNTFINTVEFMKDEKTKYISENKEPLNEFYHFNGDVIDKKTKTLTGRAFNFEKLFVTEDGFDADSLIKEAFSLYGEDNQSLLIRRGNKLFVNTDTLIPWIIQKNNGLALNDNEVDKRLEPIVAQWITHYSQEVQNRTKEFSDINGIGEEQRFSDTDILGALLNYTVAYSAFDSLFEGEPKFYKNPRTLLKRAKEGQASGKAYASHSIADIDGAPIRTLDNVSIGVRLNSKLLSEYEIPTWTPDKGIVNMPLFERNGWRGVTINNVIRGSRNIEKIKQELRDSLEYKKIDESVREDVINNIVEHYENSKVDDAQSYITFEEFIRRRYADGTIKQYLPLIESILSLEADADGKYHPENISLDGFNARIMIQKNFYYDLYPDAENNTTRPRQIKNAEFVLVPQLLGDNEQLLNLYNIMKRNDIGQINTAETSKASKKHVLNYFNNDGSINEHFEEEMLNSNAIENYYYRYLYKQQDIPSHLIDTANKAGIQIIKKIHDNLSTASPAVREASQRFFDAFSANIKEDYNKFLAMMNWTMTDDGDIINTEGHAVVDAEGNPIALNAEKFYEIALQEAARLGIDKNVIDYLTVGENGLPAMPNYLGNKASKLESIAQSLFNNHITRQKLPGWHVAQMTGVGFKNQLKYHPDKYFNGQKVITKDEYNSLSEEEKKTYYPARVIEAAIPFWRSLKNIKAKLATLGKTVSYKELLTALKEAGCDLAIIYRIPTEGKQSVAVAQIVEFLDSIYDSTAAFADEWVAQTGADMDGDSVYAITPEFNIIVTKSGKLVVKKIAYDLSTDANAIKQRYFDYVLDKANKEEKENFRLAPTAEDRAALINKYAKNHNLLNIIDFGNLPVVEQLNRKQRNNVIFDAMNVIMQDISSAEENLSCSNFDKLADTMKKFDVLRGETARHRSEYNALDQIDFMENAMSGARIKAFSVTRDTFVSLANKAQAYVDPKQSIKVKYSNINNDKIKVLQEKYDKENVEVLENNNIILNFNRYGWSKDNRNIDDILLTNDSSQTTAHILDAIKEGTIFNENEYTFGVLKTLYDLGLGDELTLGFIMSDGVTRINNNYYKINSIYSNESGNPIISAMKEIGTELLKELGITKINNKDIDKYTSIHSIFSELIKSDEVRKLLNDRLEDEEISDESNLFKLRFAISFDDYNFNSYSHNNSRIEKLTKDFVTTCLFNQIKSLSDNIETLAQHSTPDKFGAKQTIHSTRKLLDDINKYSKPKSKIGNTLYTIDKEGNPRNFMEHLYNEEDSFYPYMAALKKYSTEASVSVNSQIFDLEDAAFSKHFARFESLLGRSLNDDEHKEYNRYLVAETFISNQIISNPVTLDEDGFIIFDENELSELGANTVVFENDRVLGYEVTEDDSFEIEDINKPTRDEINKFRNLTTAQKVLWIKRNFSDNAGIFGIINVIPYKFTQLKEKGYSGSKLFFDENNNNLNDLINEFDEMFKSKHPFIKLAAIDLIKYAFLAEGFSFKSGNITKIIGNQSLLNLQIGKPNSSTLQNNVIDDIKQKISYLRDNFDEKIYERFIRSHSTFTKEIVLKPSKKNPNSLYKLWIKCKSFDNLVIIPKTEEYKDLIEHIANDIDGMSTYFRVSIQQQNSYTPTLYKVGKVSEGAIYLYPLNLLEDNEHEYAEKSASINIKNNKFNLPEYYESLIDLASTGINLKNYNNTDEGRNAIKEIKEENKVINRKPTKHKTKLVNENSLMNISKNDTYEGNEIRTFVNKALDSIANPFFTFGYVYYPGYNVSSLFSFKGNKIQKLVDKYGNEQYVRIRKIGPTEDMGHIMFDESYNKDLLPVEQQAAFSEFEKSKSNYPIFYRIERLSDEVATKLIEDAIAKTNEQTDTERHSSTSSINSSYERRSSTGAINSGILNVTRSAAAMIDLINDNYDEDFSQEKESFKAKINRSSVNIHSNLSINRNLRGVYKSLSDYYRAVANKLDEQINTFTTSDMQQFSVDDPRLYEYLLEHDEDYERLLKLLLDAKTFGEKLGKNLNIVVDSDEQFVKDAFNNIVKSINSIRYNAKISKAINNLFNIYYTKKFADNPNLKRGIVELTRAFGDTNKWDRLFSDVTELNNKQVQVIAKHAYAVMAEATNIIAPRAIDKFYKKFDEIKNRGNVNMDKIIDGNGKFIQMYTDDFFKDYEDLRNKANDALLKYSYNSLEYLKARLELDEFKANYMHQKLKKEWYINKNAILREVLDKAPELFLKYKQLTSQLNDSNLRLEDRIQENNRKQRILRNIEALLDTEGKSEEMIAKIQAVEDYAQSMKELRADYYEDVEGEDFKTNLEYYSKIINNYKKAHPSETLDMRLQNEEYRMAHDWIKMNAKYTLDANMAKEIKHAFAILRNTNTNGSIVVNSILKKGNHRDELGIIDGRTFTDEEIDEIKEEVLAHYKMNFEELDADASLINDTDKNDVVYNKKYYALFNGPVDDDINFRKHQVIARINKILERAIDEQGHISSKLLFEKVGIAGAEQLSELYKELGTLKAKHLSKRQVDKIDEVTENVINDVQFSKELAYYRTNLRNKPEGRLWREIFLNHMFDENGFYIETTDDYGHSQPNALIYSTFKVKDEFADEYVDKDKTKAKKLVEEDVRYEPTEYYYYELNKHGYNSDWFERNHIYNPYTRRWQPLSIWTTFGVNPDGKFKDGYKPHAFNESLEYVPRQEALNDEYNKHYANFDNSSVNKYTNAKYNELNSDEKEMLALLQNTIKGYNTGYRANKYFDEGFAPSRFKQKIDGKFYANEALSVLGLTMHKNHDEGWNEDFSYAYDRENPFNMADILKVKGYQKEKPLPKESDYPNNKESYYTALENVREENKKIREANLKLHKEFLDRDWRSVFGDFIANAIDYEARDKIKNEIYILLESLKDNDAISTGFFGNAVEEKRSTEDDPIYKTTEQKNTYDLVQNWGRRLIAKQFKEPNRFRNFADFMQSVTSAKYMIANLTGGIANVNTGNVNIAGEYFAGIYYGHKDFRAGQAEYLTNSFHFLSEGFFTLNNEKKTTNEAVAIVRLFNIVDYDAMMERRPNESYTQYAKRFQEALYGFQTMGEHYMQNTVLFAMLRSHRVYENKETGKTVIGSFNDYTRMLEDTALMSAVEESPNMETILMTIQAYKTKLSKDANLQKDLDSFKKDYNINILKYINDSELTKKYIEKKKELLKQAKAEFEALPTLRNELSFDEETGLFGLNKGSKITDYQLAEFRGKVISVNKKIHGVYDKLGAAYLERKWYGSLVMQYHKHLYPGIMKRYRGLVGKGYFNESRGSEEYGSIASLIKFLSIEFENVPTINDNTSDNSVAALSSIQHIFKGILNTVINIQLNWNLMSEWEKANIKRLLGDMLGVVSAFAMAIAIFGLWDDDDVADSDKLSTLIYIADRLHSESRMYTPWGLITEGKTLYSSPIAMTNSIEDAFQIMGISARWLFDKDYNIIYDSGSYKGENKIWVRIRRNIPAYRVYDRLSRMSSNNRYYRIGNTGVAKTGRHVAEIIAPDKK